MTAIAGAPRARLILVDDNPQLRSLVQRGLESQGYAVLAYGDGASALDGFNRHNPDLIILDLGLPDMDGLDVCRQVQEVASTPIVMLTARDSVEDRVEGLRAGAEDYVVKPFAMEELAARIEVILRRSEDAAPELSYDDLVIDTEAHRVWRAEREISLTPKEYILLVTLARQPNRVVTRSTLTHTLWPRGERAEDSLLDGHVANLRQKLEADGESRLVQTVRGVGFVLR